MRSWIVIPVKAPEQCKTRLRDTLTDADRHSLVGAMLRHVVGAASEIADGRVLLLGPDRHGLPTSLPLLEDAGHGLNEAAASATRAAIKANIDRITFVAADLPRVTRTDLEKLLAAPPESVAIAADRAGRGTNALALPLPLAAGFRFAYGPSSFNHHRAEAARLGLRAHEFHVPGLGFDIDTADDLAVLGNTKEIGRTFFFEKKNQKTFDL